MVDNPQYPFFFEGIENGQFYEKVVTPVSPAAAVIPGQVQPGTATSQPVMTDPAPVTIPVTQAPAANSSLFPNRNYYTDFTSYIKPQTVVGNCNAICFFNNGASTAVINNVMVILPQSGFSVNGEANETDNTQYVISFTGAGQNSLLAIRKIYTN